MDVSALVAGAALARPQGRAMRDGEGAATWAELEERVATTAGALRARGVEPGTPVAVLAPNGRAFAVAYWATLRSGGVVVPVNPLYTVPEVAHLLGDAQVRQVLAVPGLAERARRAGARLRVPPAVCEVGAQGLRGGVPVERSPAGADDLAVLCYTSGTSGRPKGARLSHGNFLANLDAIASLPKIQVEPSDVLLGALPFSHIFGLNVILNGAARAAAGVLALERFVPRASLEAMAGNAVTIAYGAPPMYAAWAALAANRPPDLRLRAAVSGADALPVRTWRRFADGYGLEILEGYGMTEAAPVVSSTAASPQVRPGTVGHPLPGVQVRILGAGEAGGGGAGEVAVRGANVFAGYHGQPAASARAFADGWFRTGDCGSLDAEGYLTLSGRLTDMIIVSGFNVYPREVEDALLQHPDVAEAAVVGVPDERTGERVVGYVTTRAPGLDPAAVLDSCRERLARYKIPREVRVVEALPRTASGKVARGVLRAPTV
jgi:long-chain acyl-CoA synthetase